MKNLDWLKDDLIAHRGFHNKKTIFENTISAIKEAIRYNYSIEIDVRMTKDEKIIVFHDATLTRVSSTNYTVKNTNYSQLQHIPLGSTSQTIPLLQDVMNVVNGSVGLLIEIKPVNRYKRICKKMIQLIKDYNGPIAIQSYDPRIVRYFKKKAPNIIRGLILEHYGHPYQPSYLTWRLANSSIWMRLSSPDFLNYNIIDLPNKKMDRYKQHGVPILSFVARSQEDLDQIKTRYDNAVFEEFVPKKRNK